MTFTSEEAKKALQTNGLSIAQFAKTFGFNVHLVYAVLAGKNKASRGESHRIAVALGLKPKPSGEPTPATHRSHSPWPARQLGWPRLATTWQRDFLLPLKSSTKLPSIFPPNSSRTLKPLSCSE